MVDGDARGGAGAPAAVPPHDPRAGGPLPEGAPPERALLPEHPRRVPSRLLRPPDPQTAYGLERSGGTLDKRAPERPRRRGAAALRLALGPHTRAPPARRNWPLRGGARYRTARRGPLAADDDHGLLRGGH